MPWQANRSILQFPPAEYLYGYISLYGNKLFFPGKIYFFLKAFEMMIICGQNVGISSFIFVAIYNKMFLILQCFCQVEYLCEPSEDSQL